MGVSSSCTAWPPGDVTEPPREMCIATRSAVPDSKWSTVDYPADVAHTPRSLPFRPWPSSSHPSCARSSRATRSSRTSPSRSAASDRLSLAGANGAGKTTLLRAIAGETSLQGGKLAFAKGTRVALHDQRPPLEFDITLREYALSGARDLLDVEAELRRLEQAMAEGAHDDATLRRYAEAQARLEHAGGWAWRDRAAAAVRGPRVRRRRPRPSARHVLGRRADARVARARARGQPRPAPPRRADEPPRRPEPRVARARARDDRRRGDPRRARPLVPRGGDDLRARARAGRRALLLGPVARVAAGEGGARGGGRQDRGSRLRRHRSPRALRRAVPLQEVEGEAGAGEAHADRAPREGALGGTAGGRVADEEAPHARVRLPRPAAERSHRPRSRGRRALGRRQAAPRRRDDRRRAWREGRARRAERRRARRRCSRRSSTAIRSSRRNDPARARRRARLLLAARARAARRAGSVLDATAAATGLPRPQRAEAARPVPVLGLGDARALGDRALRAASAGGSRSRCSSRRARTSSCSTSRRTTSTSSRARRSRLRSRRFPGRCSLVSHDRALLDAVPDRIVAFEDRALRSYDGGWADLERERSERAAPVREPEPEARASRRRSRRADGRRSARRPSSSASKREIAARGGADRRPRAQARRRLDEHGRPRRASCCPRRAGRAPRTLGGAVRGGARDVTRAAPGGVQRACMQ